MQVTRTLFVVWLFITALACLSIAAMNASMGWFGGGVVLFLVAIFALRQFKNERFMSHEERAGTSGRFLALAILVMIVCMFLLSWLSSRG